jgi:hypothetical protein
MAPERRHIELTEEIGCLPIPWQPRRRRPVSVRPIEELELFQYDDRESERRCLAFTFGSRDYVLEIIRPGIPRSSAFG